MALITDINTDKDDDHKKATQITTKTNKNEAKSTQPQPHLIAVSQSSCRTQNNFIVSDKGSNSPWQIGNSLSSLLVHESHDLITRSNHVTLTPS